MAGTTTVDVVPSVTSGDGYSIGCNADDTAILSMYCMDIMDQRTIPKRKAVA